MIFSDTLVKSFLKKQYELDIVSLERIKIGLMNINYKVRCSSGNSYIFKIYDLAETKSALYTARLLKFLSDRDFPCPVLSVSKRGELVSLFNKKPCVLYDYIHGSIHNHFKKKDIYEVGFFLGKMHKKGLGFKQPFKKTTWDQEDLKKIVRKNKSIFLKSRLQGASLLIKSVVSELDRFNFPKNLPFGITHQDVKPENVVFSKGKVKGFLDFDNSYKGVLLNDLTTAIIWSCFKNNIMDYSLLNSYLRGYSKSRKLTKIEKDNLLEGIKFRILRESFIGPFALHPHEERAQARSGYFLKLYNKFKSASILEFNSKLNYE